MISEVFIKLNDSQRKKIERKIEVLKKERPQFKFSILIGSILLEMGILYLIYLYEDFDYSIILKALTIAPIWIIIALLFFYFDKLAVVNKKIKPYRLILKHKAYEALKITPKECYHFVDEHKDYYVFPFEPKRTITIRRQDFNTSETDFPNTIMIVPYRELFDVIGNTIFSKGEKLSSITESNLTPDSYNRFRDVQIGEVIISY